MSACSRRPGPSPQKTVADRLAECGAAVEARLEPDFRARQISYPPARLVLLGLKEEKRLEVYAANRNGQLVFIRTYPILAASGGPGPKLREGDGQVPEGVYRIESLNPNSLYHLSLRVNYPNEEDRAIAAEEGRENLGGDIMIHGSNASVGCLAMGDQAAEDLFILAAKTGIEHITVLLAPRDFRKAPASDADLTNQPPWLRSRYEELQKQLAPLSAPEL